jgi:tetratricopeptide (TPR) repeat protein
MIFSVGADADRDGCSPRFEVIAPHKAPGGFVLRLLIASATAPLLLLSACQTPGQEADALAQQAQQLSDAGDGPGAIRAIRSALKLRDDKAEYYLLMSAIYMRGGSPAEAYSSARRALDLDSANRTALTLVANVGLQVGQIDEAEDAADRLLSLDPGSLVGLQVKGLVALFRDKNDEADAFAKRLLTLSPTDEAGAIIQTRVLAKERRFDEALTFLQGVIGQGQVTPALLITKVNLYRVLGRPEEMATAFEEIEKAVENQPSSLLLDRINLLYKLGRKDEARRVTARLMASPAVGVKDYEMLQRMWSEFDRVPYTRETIKAAKDWRDPIALLSIGRYLLWQGEPQLANDLYFAFRPGARPIGISIHHRALMGLGRTADAERGQAAVMERDTTDVDALLIRADAQAKTGNMGLAIEAAQKALNADPNDPEIYVALAGLHAKSGANWRASQAFEDGLKQLPQSFLLIERYTQFLHESGNKSRAVSVTRAFARSMPSSVLAWTIMARQCEWAADKACAIEAAAGRQAAATDYELDDPPGTPKDRGLLGKF